MNKQLVIIMSNGNKYEVENLKVDDEELSEEGMLHRLSSKLSRITHLHILTPCQQLVTLSVNNISEFYLKDI